MLVEYSEMQRNIVSERVKFRWHFNKNYSHSSLFCWLDVDSYGCSETQKNLMDLFVFILLKQKCSNSEAFAAKEHEATVLFSPNPAPDVRLNHELVEQTWKKHSCSYGNMCRFFVHQFLVEDYCLKVLKFRSVIRKFWII